MGASITVDRGNFETEVVQKSHEKPVLVDFFAQWCGPCQMLKPMLEKLAQEYDFVLAKVDIDASPDLAHDYSVEGVPDVRIVVNGEVNPGFVGVLPEPQLRQLMAQLNLKSALDTALEGIQAAIERGDRAQAETQLTQLLQQHPKNNTLKLEAARFYIQTGQLDTAESVLQAIGDRDRDYITPAKSLRALILFQRASQQPVGDTDLDRTFHKAAIAALRNDFETALQLFLEVVSLDRGYQNDAGRKAMLAIFDLLGDDHPLTRHYRRLLTRTLY
jgi:putative thioredoxin